MVVLTTRDGMAAHVQSLSGSAPNTDTESWPAVAGPSPGVLIGYVVGVSGDSNWRGLRFRSVATTDGAPAVYELVAWTHVGEQVTVFGTDDDLSTSGWLRIQANLLRVTTRIVDGRVRIVSIDRLGRLQSSATID